MTSGTAVRYPVIRASVITVLLAVAVGIGLFQASSALRLRSFHSSTNEILGWASLGLALVALVAPSVFFRRFAMAPPTNVAWAWLLIVACLPAGYLLMHVSGPPWLNSDLAAGVLSFAMAALSLALSASGLLASRRDRGLYAVSGAAALLVAAGIAWAMLFFE